MKREIKFRAWDKDNKEMFEPVIPFGDSVYKTVVIDIDFKGDYELIENQEGIDGYYAGTMLLDNQGVRKLENEYSKAMKVIIEELKNDKTPGSIYYGWQSNIACCIMDNSNIEHEKANEIAIKFLDFLTRER